jgi:peptidoglycan/LPS O-acetylase OafA/YrhL
MRLAASHTAMSGRRARKQQKKKAMGMDYSKGSSYRGDIEGLRAVAVLPVVAFHIGVSAVPGGFVGVDIFFVISGFLITRLLVADMEAGRFTFLRFYERRVRRIIPALVSVL